MSDQSTTRRQKVLTGSSIAFAVLASLYAIAIVVIEGVGSAVTPILIAVSADLNCALFLMQQTSPSRSN